MKPFTLNELATSLLNDSIRAKNQSELNQVYAWRDIYKVHGAFYGADLDNFLALEELSFKLKVKKYNPWFFKRWYLKFKKINIEGLYEFAGGKDKSTEISIIVKNKNGILKSEIISNPNINQNEPQKS
ncbi:MAG: hypothetical protein POELPBGB_01334 [Bacteroidia bacterium]|nr:hypothetical protein [Bacteroidia bacterium]